jgi:hypothetical protein
MRSCTGARKFAFVVFSATIAFMTSCSVPHSEQAKSSTMSFENQPDTLWDFSLENKRDTSWGGYQVFDSTKKKFVDAPEQDQKIIRDYPFWIDKGPLLDSTRVTLTTARLRYQVGEPVRVAHIVEETETGRTLYIMGPKEIRDEFVNDVLKTAATQDPGDYPWLPMSYDGAVLPSPGVDYNFGITEYRFDQPGVYRIQWRPGRYRSNVLSITVK